MIIGNKNYRISILILFMEHEADVTVATVEMLMEGIEEGVVISILLNGGSRPDLKNLFASCPTIRYYESPTNLGVAGGRNFLLSSRESGVSDIIMFVDNDVIPPADYVRNLATFLVARPGAGIVGASVLNVRPFLDRNFEVFRARTGVFGNSILTTTSARLRDIVVGRFDSDLFNHIGGDRDWYNTYVASLDLRESVKRELGLKKTKGFFAHVKFNKRLTFSYFNSRVKEIQVSNVIGATQTFRRRLVDEIGKLNDAFNPYGYEDADFSIRVLKKGYKNYIDLNTFLLHGTDERHGKRQDVQLQSTITNEFRCLTLLYRLHFPDDYEALIKRRIFHEYLLRHVTGERTTHGMLYWSLRGFTKGQEQIRKKRL